MGKHRIICAALIFALVLSVFPAPVRADFITIGTVEDFDAFAKSCTLDSYSEGLTVTLTADLDFSRAAFTPVPIFSGTFDGAGHTVSGINYTKSGSNTGFFRYIKDGAKVHDLTVRATFAPGGTKSTVGGICGENSGSIERCSFYGSACGDANIGGIAGSNTESGSIIGCSAAGSVTGENSVGGIAGKNDGFIQSSNNNASVNTIYSEKTTDISGIDVDAGAIVENYKTEKEQTEETSFFGHSDCGGIAGFSRGIVQGCANYGEVGYSHVGYNIGGIIGRQSGYVLGCRNYGIVNGRKDVGGIVGQSEPYIRLTTTQMSLKNLRSELNTLNSMTQRFIADTDSLSSDTLSHLRAISGYSKDARADADSMLDQGTDFVDGNVAEINAKSALLSDTLDKLDGVFDDMSSGFDDLSSSIDNIQAAIDELDIYFPDLSGEMNKIEESLRLFARAARVIRRSAEQLDRASSSLDNAVKFNDTRAARQAISAIKSAVDDISSAHGDIRTAAKDIEDALSERPESFEEIGVDAERIIADVRTIKDAADASAAALEEIAGDLTSLSQNAEVDFDAFRSAAASLEKALGHLDSAMGSLADGLSDLADAVDSIDKTVSPWADDIEASLDGASDDLSNALSDAGRAAKNIQKAIDKTGDIVSDLANEEPLEFVRLGDDFRESSDSLFDNLTGIADEIASAEDRLDDGSSTMNAQLSALGAQFNLIMNLFIDEIEDFEDGIDNIGEIYVDDSDEDIASARQGKIDGCANYGEIHGDRSVGGVVGTMAIEYAKDPEDDIEKPTSVNFTYRTKAIVAYCTNEGKVFGKKDCIGGVVGQEDIGTVYECENYSAIESASGNYVGGIVGKSASAVKKSFAKCPLSGGRYVGGIAGRGERVVGCYSIVQISGDESIGAICGSSDELDGIYRNFYVDNGVGAIDSISYASLAEPISYDALSRLSEIPCKFLSFTVKFIADGKTVSEMQAAYGDDTRTIKYPEVPEKEGCFGVWEKIEEPTVIGDIEVNCEYSAYVTVVSSDEKNESGALALALAEGDFTDRTRLNVTGSELSAPEGAFSDRVVWDVKLTDSGIAGGGEVTIRFINEEKRRVTLYVYDGINWVETPVTAHGKYVIAKLYGENNTVCIVYGDAMHTAFWTVLLALLLAAAAAVGIIKKKRRPVKKAA